MLTITSKLQLDLCRSEKNKLEFEQLINSNRLQRMTKDVDNWVEGQLSKMQEAAGKDFNKNDAMKVIQDDPNYQAIAAEENAMETRKLSIETELKALNESMQAFEKYHETGAKNDTTFWCFGS